MAPWPLGQTFWSSLVAVDLVLEVLDKRPPPAKNVLVFVLVRDVTEVEMERDLLPPLCF